MAGVLYKFFEADDVGAASGTPLVAGEETQTYTIPNGETWQIFACGGSASTGSCEVELLYTDDGGTTWANPWDTSADKLTCLHVATGNPVRQDFPHGMEFTGDGTNVQLKMEVKNWNTSVVSEITMWVSGYMK